MLNNIKKKIPEYTILIPTSDIYALYLADLKDELKEKFSIIAPKKEVVKTLVNKKNFYQSLLKYNISFPATYFPESVNDVKKISKEIEYPVYIRPCISQLFHSIFKKKGFIAYSKQELQKYYFLALKNNVEMIIQEIIFGPDANIYNIAGYFDQYYKPKALFAYRRLRWWPPMFGSSCLMENVSISDISLIKDIVVKFLGNIHYHGIYEAEFKKDPKDNNYKFLEVNARSWWQNRFPTRCGINIILLAYLDIINEKIDYTENYKTGFKWIYTINDIRASLNMIKKNKLTIKKWLFSLRYINDYALFSSDDPLPSICSKISNLLKI